MANDYQLLITSDISNQISRDIGSLRAGNYRMANQRDEGAQTYGRVRVRAKGTGPNSAGQSGDTQGLSDVEDVGSQSVEELVEEGQGLEANVIAGVEDAADADAGPVRTREVPEDDVPREYDNQEREDTR
jgi:hypothetical protein